MTQPPGGPPQAPPPWGHYPAPPPQPQPPSDGWKIVCGAVIGFAATVLAPFAALGLADSLGFGIFLLSFVLVPGTGIALLASATTRKWGLGLIIGWAITLVVGAGACVALLSGLS
jgi:hypothetical protein